MANLLYLVHRLPYPPNKGDKVRSYHMLKHLASRHRVFLGTFVDDPDDERHVDTVAQLCAGMHAVRLDPRIAKAKSLAGLATGTPLSLAYYVDAGLRRWVAAVASAERIDASVVFSSAMAPYAQALPEVPMLLDFVDVDSAKWAQYADSNRWPLAWLYRREGELLLASDRAAAAASKRSFFVTANEAALFCRLAPECSDRVEAIGNGVDADFFSPSRERPTPFEPGVLPVVFTGAMDYWPNADAVCWFVADMLPTLAAAWPRLRFFIVGRNPSASVRALASDRVVVTGSVPDVRPYLQHAAAVVAPLRLARGIQNKVLEAMAMMRPVVATRSCVESVGAPEGEALLAASDAAGFVAAVDGLLASPDRAARIGTVGRDWVRCHCTWDAQLARIDRHLEPAAAAAEIGAAA